MSGGGSTPSAPSYGTQINNANTTAGTATSDAQQTMNTAQALNTNSQNNLAGVTNQANSAAGAIANTANQNLQTYGSTFVPLQQTEAQAAQTYGSDANIARLQGQAIGNANQADQAALTNSKAALASEGVDPASIGGAASDAQAAITGAAGVANAGTQSAIQTQQTAFGMENTANQLGTQVGQMGTAGAATGAATAEGGQNTLNSTNNSNVNNLTAANSYLNTDINANNSATNAQNVGFQNQQTVYQDQQAQQAAQGQLLGTGLGVAGKVGGALVGGTTGAALSFLESGGPVPAGAGIPTMPHPHYHAGPRMRATRPSVPFGIDAGRGNRGAWTATDYQAGGEVTSQGALPQSPIPGSTDTKPAFLTPGEFVIPRDAAEFMGHEYWHKQIDKAREAQNKRRAIPVMHPPHQSMH